MTRLRVLWNRCLEVLLRRRRERRLDEEIDLHLELLADDYMARGLSEADARAAARRAFGNVTRVTEDHRGQRGLPFFESLLQDTRLAGRMLHRHASSTAAIVAVLALGIGVNNMLFTIVNAHTLRGLPIPSSDRVMYISTIDDRTRDRGVSFLDFEEWRAEARSFSEMAAYTTAPVVLGERTRPPDRLDATFLSGAAFHLAGTSPVLGRLLAPADDQPGAPRVVGLSRSLWESRYGSDPGVIGREITVDGQPAVIVGIVPDRSGLPSTSEVWLPLAQFPGAGAPTREARPLRIVARLRDGAGLEQARAEIATLAGRADAQTPGIRNLIVRAIPIDRQVLGSLSDPAWISFMAAGLLVLIVSCANAANLMLTRSVLRSREIAIRLSLGASRARVVRQLLVEGGAIAAVACVAGFGVASAGVRLFSAAIPERALPYWMAYTPDGRVLAALIIVSASSVLLFALVPAFQATKADVSTALKEDTRTAARRGSQRWMTAFLAAEFGLAVVLLSHFVVNLRGSQSPLATDRLLEGSPTLTAAIDLPSPPYTPAQRPAILSALLDRLAARDDVSSASLAGGPMFSAEERQLLLPGTTAERGDERPTVRAVAVAPRYFDTMGFSLIRGGDFAADDAVRRTQMIVNERFVELFLGGQDPIGERAAVPAKDSGDEPAWLTIVGVAPTMRVRARASREPVVYLPVDTSSMAQATLLARSNLPTNQLVDLVKGELQAVDPNLPIYRTRTVSRLVHEATWVGRVSSNTSLALVWIAVLMATVGLYAVTAHGVTRRTQEFGVRVAMGATPLHIIRLVAARVGLHLAIGFGVGVACTRIWSWFLPTGRPGISASDPQSLLGAAGFLVVLAAFAAILPARRAARLNPVDAIRQP